MKRGLPFDYFSKTKINTLIFIPHSAVCAFARLQRTIYNFFAAAQTRNKRKLAVGFLFGSVYFLVMVVILGFRTAKTRPGAASFCLTSLTKKNKKPGLIATMAIN
jgi:hypothetical protein